MTETTVSTHPAAADGPIRNLRVRLWGVQGSCPMSPEPHEVEEAKRLLAQGVIKRVVADLRRERGRAVDLDALLARLDGDAAAVAVYQQALGLPDVPVYGSETTCLSVETADGDVILLDGGSGIRNASRHLADGWGDRPRLVHLFLSHEHLDHRSGLPFCRFCFSRPPFAVRTYGTRQSLTALDERFGVFSRHVTEAMHLDDPVDYRLMSARFEAIEIQGDAPPAPTAPWARAVDGKTININATTVTPFEVYHGPTRCLAYKIEHGPAAFVFCTDHELRHGPDPDDPRQRRSMAAEARLVEHCRDADLAYFDGQYLLAEYAGGEGIGATAPVPRLDWGHSCVEDIVDRCQKCAVKRALIGHHDPERSWRDRTALEQRLPARADDSHQVELAKAGMVFDL